MKKFYLRDLTWPSSIKKGPEEKKKNLYNESNLPFLESMSNFPSLGVLHKMCESKLV
jgi:hypothetical protein